MDCPACTSPMSTFTELGIELDECPACGGIWFDEGELKRLLASGESIVQSVESHITPQGVNAGGVVSDRFCPHCIVHLDTYH